MIRRPPRATQVGSSAASDVYKRQGQVRQPDHRSPAQRLVGVLLVEPGATLTLRDLTLTGADVSGDGGAISSAGRLTLDNVRLIDNSATQGGAVAATGTVRIDDSHFVGNQAARGGAISIGAGETLTATTSTFVQNAASVEGGALYLAGSATLTDTTGSANDAPNAGAIRRGTICLGRNAAGRGVRSDA